MIDRQLPLISCAVVCKNEAANIERCLTSLFRETAGLNAEVLVVDSYSTDATVELARRFPVKIVQLGHDWPHSPAAGRFTAVCQARGKYLFVIDGDMELLPGFLPAALCKVEADSTVVAVRGRLHNYHQNGETFSYVNSDYCGNILDRAQEHQETASRIGVANGAALFRLAAVRAAGNFHPFLRGEEEGEIARRLRGQGGVLWYLPIDAVNHYGYHPDPLAEVVRRLRRGMTGAAGQMFRLSIEEGFCLSYLRRIYQHLALGGFFLLTLLSLPAMPIWPWLVPLCIAGHIVVFSGYWYKTGAPRAALAAYMMKLIIGIEVLRGVFRKVPHRGSYPTEVTIIPGTRSSDAAEAAH